MLAERMPGELQDGVSPKRLMPSELLSNDGAIVSASNPNKLPGLLYVTDDKFYLLTYQPAPISAWVLHPQDNNASRDTLSTIIQRALTQQPATKTRRNS